MHVLGGVAKQVHCAGTADFGILDLAVGRVVCEPRSTLRSSPLADLGTAAMESGEPACGGAVVAVG